MATNFKQWLESNTMGLVPGKTYRAMDIQFITAPGDLKSVSEWMDMPLENLIFVYQLVPITVFAKQAEDMLGTYDEFPQSKRRTNKISRMIKQGQPLYPVFVAEGDASNFIMEGRHRIVSFWQAGISQIPVFYVRKSL